MKKPMYLDYAAATPLDARVLVAMQPYFTDSFYNPSATYLAARAVRRDIEAARARVAQVLGARNAEIIFTPGATAANTAAVRGVMERYPGKKMLVSSIEHESMLRLITAYAGGEVPVTPGGVIDLAALERLIDDDTVLVSVMYANNEIGTIQPIREVGRLTARVREMRRKNGNDLPLYLHTDASQAASYLDLHISRLGVDLMVLNGAKIYGPKQTGALYARAGVPVQARFGTDNVPAIIGMATALELVQNERHEEVKRLTMLQNAFFGLLEQKIPHAAVNGSRKLRLPGNVHITIPGQDNERLLMALDEAGIMAAAGSACTASSGEPSHVLRALGVSDADARASLRFTMGRATTMADIERTVDTLARIIAEK